MKKFVDSAGGGSEHGEAGFTPALFVPRLCTPSRINDAAHTSAPVPTNRGADNGSELGGARGDLFQVPFLPHHTPSVESRPASRPGSRSRVGVMRSSSTGGPHRHKIADRCSGRGFSILPAVVA